MRRCGRQGERGAETLEFVGILPLLALVGLVIWQGIALVRQQAEADADARTLARQAVVCDAGTLLTLRDIDPAVGVGWAATDAAHGPWVTVSVTLAPTPVVSTLDLSRLGIPSPRATVTMRHEPC